MRFFLILAFLTPLFANGYDVGGTSIQLTSPDSNHEEACLDQNVKDYVSKSTDAQSLLITCYANMQEWSQGNGTIIHKVEIVKAYEEKIVSAIEFEKEINSIYGALKQYNNHVLKSSGKLTDAQINAIDSIKNSSNIQVDIEIKNALMKEIESSEKHVVVGNTNRVMVNGEAKLSYTLICFLNIKGKILTLRSINTVQGDETFKKQLALLKNWIKSIQSNNV